jgi:endonuclease/exonuclease/phosphatase family metal-dependent hydrolase
MSIRIGSWNVEQRLTQLTRKRRGAPDHIVDGIEALDCDVLVLPEAYQNQPAQGVDTRLHAMGYEWRDTAYEDQGRESGQENSMPYMRILSRLAILDFEVVRFGGIRNMAVIVVEDPETGQRLRIIGTHLRDDVAWMRTAQVAGMVAHQQCQAELPTVAAGDFNDMHENDYNARFLGSRVMRWCGRIVPHAHVRDVAQRLSEMATGSALRAMEHDMGMIDLDLRHQPTATPKMRGTELFPSIPLAQIDHIYASPGIENDGVLVAKDGGADHRAISTTIRLASQ